MLINVEIPTIKGDECVLEVEMSDSRSGDQGSKSYKRLVLSLRKTHKFNIVLVISPEPKR